METLICDWCERELPSTQVDKLKDSWGIWVLNQCKDIKDCKVHELKLKEG